MDWLALLLASVKLIASFARWLGDKRLIEAGAAQALAAQLEATDALVSKAAAARGAAVADFRAHGVRDDDPNLRD